MDGLFLSIPCFLWLQHALIFPAAAAAAAICPGEPLAGTAVCCAPYCRHEPHNHKPSQSNWASFRSGHYVFLYHFIFRYECCLEVRTLFCTVAV
jgi:hypothetical protein